MTGLTVVLGNAAIQLLLPELEAKDLVEGYRLGKLREIVGGTTTDGQSWSFRPSECKGLFTFDAQKLLDAQQQQQVGYVSQGYASQRSGI